MSDLPPPPPPPFQPPPGYLPPPANIPPPGYSGQVPPPYMPVAAVGAGSSLLSQFSGVAAWSIGFGVVSIVVPFVSNFYFPIMPIIGALNGFRAIQRGRVLGGIIGLVLNAIGGLVALIFSGTIRL